MKMYFWMLTLCAGLCLGAGWESVQRIAPAQKVEVTRVKDQVVKGRFVSATDTVLIVRTKAGEQSLAKADVERVRVAEPGRRTRNGLLGTAIGLGAGIGLGFAVCPGCANEGSGGKYVGPAGAAGAGLGAAAGFLPTPLRTIYIRP